MLLAVSEALQGALAEWLVGERAEALEVGGWLVLQLDEGEIKGLPEAVEVIAWPRQKKGAGEKTREASLAWILELAGPAL